MFPNLFTIGPFTVHTYGLFVAIGLFAGLIVTMRIAKPEGILNEKTSLHVEQFFRNMLSEIFGLGKEMISEKDYEVDIALTDFKKLKIVGEVKWKRRITKNEIKRIEHVLKRFDCRKILIVPDKENIEGKISGIEVWDVKKILNEINAK